MPRFVDLSAPIAPSPEGRRSSSRPTIEYSDHADGAAEIEALLGVPPRLLRDGEGWAGEKITPSARTTRRMSTRRSTTTRRSAASRRRRSTSCRSTGSSRPASSLDFTAKADGDAVTADEMEPALAAPATTSASATSCSSAPAATASTASPTTCSAARASPPRRRTWLFERGVRVMGIDAWGWDRPLNLQAADALRTRRAGHLLGGAPVRPAVLADRAARSTWRRCRRRGFTVACFPLKIVGRAPRRRGWSRSSTDGYRRP